MTSLLHTRGVNIALYLSTLGAWRSLSISGVKNKQTKNLHAWLTRYDSSVFVVTKKTSANCTQLSPEQ